MARVLARAGISANLISVLGMVAALLAAGALVATNVQSSLPQGLLFLAAAAGIQLRLLANMLDGMVAIASNKASPIGELFNEVPDRISDTAILVAAGYAAGGEQALGMAAAVMALFVTYIRALGKGMGVPGLFQGPMAKSHRMFTLTCTCIYLAAAPTAWTTVPIAGRSVGVMTLSLSLIMVGSLITAWRRTAKIVSALKER
jgi:phosphatidylglycerophosphate synthase